jgi:hypothetical protein
MNDRDRFLSIARFERMGDPYEFHPWMWLEAVERWRTEGLPPEANAVRVASLGQDSKEFLPLLNTIRCARPYDNPPYNIAIDPRFPRELITDEGETQVVREEDGTVCRVSKLNPSAFPQFLEFPVKDRASWERYKKLLDPHSPGRWPSGWERIDLSRTTFDHNFALNGRPWKDRDFPLGMTSLSLMGLPRNMMGLEQFSMALYDQRDLVEEIADHMLLWNLEMARKVFAAGVTLDFCYLWEDICYKNGPLFSPRIMREIMVPRWRTFTDFLRANGVAVIVVDCDGNVEQLLPLLLEGGVNGLLPFEVTAGNDILETRRRYGKNLILFGGIDKRALSRGRAAIDAELEGKVQPLLEQGGYFPMLDHYAPPDISFENFMYYRIKLKSKRSLDHRAEKSD